MKWKVSVGCTAGLVVAFAWFLRAEPRGEIGDDVREAMLDGRSTGLSVPAQPTASILAVGPLGVAASARWRNIVQDDIAEKRPAERPDREELAEMAEAEAMLALDNRPEQRVWRSTYNQESEDPAWTASMREELENQGKRFLKGKLQVEELRCAETVCRMHIRFEDQLDAQDFIKAQRPPGTDYAFQSLDPYFDGEGFDESDHTYEVLVKRVRPAGLVHRPPTPSREASASGAAVGAGTP